MINLTNITLMSSTKPYRSDLPSSKSLHEHDSNEGHIIPGFLGFPGQLSHNPNQHSRQSKEMTLADDKSLKQGLPKNEPHHKKKSFMGRRKPLLTRSAVSVVPCLCYELLCSCSFWDAVWPLLAECF